MAESRICRGSVENWKREDSSVAGGCQFQQGGADFVRREYAETQLGKTMYKIQLRSATWTRPS